MGKALATASRVRRCTRLTLYEKANTRVTRSSMHLKKYTLFSSVLLLL